MALNPRWIVAGLAVWALLPLFARDTETDAEPTLPVPPPRDLPGAQQRYLPARGDFTIRKLPGHIAKDSLAVCTSPARLRERDLRWFFPLLSLSGACLIADRHVMAALPPDPRFTRGSREISDTLITGLLAGPLVLFAAGNLYGNQKAREAGFVAGEAIGDAFLLDQILKLVSWRERPDAGDRHGLFFKRDAGVNSSFLSSHSMLAWTSASVIANEYPHPAVEAALYALAGTVSLTRVLGQRHFPTDVLLGGAAGWFIGHYVFRARHHVALPEQPDSEVQRRA